MIIIDLYYDQDEEILEVRYTLDVDSDYDRSVKLTPHEIKYYSSTIIEDEDIPEIDEDSLIDILESYFNENEMGEEEFL